MELVVLGRLYNRSIVVYNELSVPKEVHEQVFPSALDEGKGYSVDQLENPVSFS